MITKYGYNFTAEVEKTDARRLINQVWKLVPMKEKDEDWVGHLNTVIEEVSGLGKIYPNDNKILVLLSKLEGLTHPVCEDFMLYRKTVFRCIDLLAKVFAYG